MCYPTLSMRLTVGLLVLITGCGRHHPFSPMAAEMPHNQTILVIGQSNNVRFERYGETTFITAYRNSSPSSKIIFINCAVGGTSISQWQYGGELMNQCNTGGRVPTAILFYQGESDAALGTQNWNEQFTSAVTGFRKTFNSPKLPVIYAQIAVEDPMIFCPLSQWQDIQRQQTEVSIPGVAMIKTSDVSQLDPDPAIAAGVHLSAKSYANIAVRYAQALAAEN